MYVDVCFLLTMLGLQRCPFYSFLSPFLRVFAKALIYIYSLLLAESPVRFEISLPQAIRLPTVS
jgi:hypothetical protein